MRFRWRPMGALLMAAALLASAPAHAQRVELAGRGDPDWDLRLRDLIRAGGFTVLPNDTLIANGDTIHGSVMAAGVTVRLAGVIVGDLIGIDANLFLRPGARVTGDVLNVAGGYYPSEQATVGGTVTSDPTAPYDVERAADGFRIVGTEERSLLDFDGIFGFHPPRYDRVDGLTLAWGARYMLPRLGLVEPFVAGRIGYHFERKELAGGGELGVRRRRTELAVGAERWTFTNEEWIRNDLLNAWSTFSTGRDYRNYYEADRFYAEARRMFERGARTSQARLRFQLEDARSLPATEPYTLFEPDSIRSNPGIDDGRITSAILGLDTEWLRADSELEGSLQLELARELLDGDVSFGGFLIDADYAMRAFANHTLEIEGHFQGPLPGTDSLPRQRWSFVGGSSTLYTFEFNQFPGDRIVYVESEYFIPFSSRLRLPLVGIPMLGVFHHIGKGWSHDVDSTFEQNIGARLILFALYFRVVIDPSNTDNTEFGVGLTMPKRWPWQQ
jgi:hypothetical protein